MDFEEREGVGKLFRLDPDLSLRLVRLFAELNKMGTTIILATHELPLLDSFPFARMQLDDGQVLFSD